MHARFGRLGMVLAASITLVVAAMAVPAAAQSTGMLKGKVVDAQNLPVEGAQISIEFKEGVTRKHQTKTNKRGEFIQIGLFPGNYSVTAEKDKMTQSFDVRVRLGSQAEVNFQLAPGSGAGRASKEDLAKADNLKKAFEEGVTFSRAGSYDEAIAKFNEALAIVPNCADCYYNIGFAYAQQKKYSEAEGAFKKALEVNPEYVDAYNGLANVYNAQKKFDEAAAASAEAAKRAGAAGTGGSVDAIYNQGVIFWNAGKIAEAKKQFEEAIKMNPSHAEAHYWLGMANLNEGKMPEAAAAFDEYLKLAPDGQYAATAKGILAQIKK